MTRMSEERLEAIRGCDQCVWISPGIPPTSCDFDRRDLLLELDALRAELSAFRRAVLTDGAGGTEEEVTPETLEAELRLLRETAARALSLEEGLKAHREAVAAMYPAPTRAPRCTHEGIGLPGCPTCDVRTVSEGGPRPDAKIAPLAGWARCVCGHGQRIHRDNSTKCMFTCPCERFEAAS